MGGVATFTGTNYQANAIAFVYVHLLGGHRLAWLAPFDDTPSAAEAETHGGGDDLRVEIANTTRSFEVQAKHGLTGGRALHESLAKMVDRVRANGLDWNEVDVVFVVDGTTSGTVRHDFAADLDRLRSGRSDSLSKTTTDAMNALGANAHSILRSLRVVTVDLDTYDAPHKKLAMHMLSTVLVDSSLIESAWASLTADANLACSMRLRRTRADLVALLAGSGVVVRRPSREDRWRHDLEIAKALRDRFATTQALRILADVERDMGMTSDSASPEVLRDLEISIGATLLVANQLSDARRRFNRALQLTPGNPIALAQLAQIATLEGTAGEADSLIDQAIANGPDHEIVWAAAAIVDQAAGRQFRSTPPRIAQSERYQLTRVNLAAQVQAFEDVLVLSSALLQQGRRPAAALVARAYALISTVSEVASSNTAVREAIELTDEALQTLDPLVDPRARHALSIRAVAHRRLGDFDAEAKDLELLSAASPLDPNAILGRALRALRLGGNESALAELQNPATERHGQLLALRARIQVRLGDVNAARKDADAALQLSADADNPEYVRVRVAEVMIAFADNARARAILSGVVDQSRDAIWYVTMGKLFLLEQDLNEATRAFEQALELSPLELRDDLVVECGLELLERKFFKQAIEILERVEFAALEDEGRSALAKACLAAGEFSRADSILRRAIDLGAERPWVLALAAQLAVLREDPGSAITYLEKLVASGKATADAELHLARFYLQAGRSDDAVFMVERVLDREAIEPAERMSVAHILAQTSQLHRALPLAIAAFRDAPDRGYMHRGLIGLALFTPNVSPPAVETVGANTHVVLVTDDEETATYTIFDEPPIAFNSDEFVVSDAAVQDLLGKRIGDTVIRGGGWNERKLVVKEIKSIELHLVQDAMLNYERRFPNEPFIFAMKVGTGQSVKSFAPLLSSLAERRKHAEEVLRIYRSQVFPLGIVAQSLGVTIAEVIQAITASKEVDESLFVEWADAAGQQKAIDCAMASFENPAQVVLTESAIWNADQLGLLASLEGFPNLVVPQALVDDIAKRIADLTADSQRTSLGTVTSSDTGFLFAERNEEQLNRTIDGWKRLLEWIAKHATVLPRPIEALHVPGTEEYRVRQILGAASMDALDLAAHTNRVLFADDLGLRRLLRADGEKSFGTPSLTAALSAVGKIHREQRERIHRQMLRSRFFAIRLLPDTVASFVTHEHVDGRAVVDRALTAVTLTSATLADAASSMVLTLRVLITSSIRSVEVSTTTTRMLESLSRRWSRIAVAIAVRREASRVLSLLPNELDEVERICAGFPRAGLPIVGP
jgi:tetratricopeptide (TPR) repeat protein